MTPPIPILGVPIYPWRMAECIRAVLGWLDGEKQRSIVTPNAEILVQAARNPALRAALLSADLAIADGASVVWALRRAGVSMAERVTGVDLMQALCAACAAEGKRVFLLGGFEGLAKDAERQLVKSYPGLVVAGTFPGDGSAIGDEASLKAIRQATEGGSIDLLFVAYGAPKQELWLQRNLSKLPCVRVGMVVGGSFDLIAGRQSRAPAWMQSAGLEWLYRLIQEPWRWRRMLRLPVFVYKVLFSRDL